MNPQETEKWLEDRKLRFIDVEGQGGYLLVGPGTLWEVYLNRNSDREEWYIRMLTGTTFCITESVVKEALI